ncbi:UNVERIFIED_CONTAM: hypothetical protein Sindi_1707200 [Sesamum indicum]
MKPSDGYKIVQLAPGEQEKTIRIGANMGDGEMAMIEFLRKNVDMFSWSLSDFTGIDLEIIVHRLNVDPTVRLVQQRKRSFGSDKNEIIRQEVTSYSRLDLNKPCPKDPYPLPRIDVMIHMAEEDRDKTSFITDKGIYCYNMMLFGLKSAGATYQRLVNKMFGDLLRKTMQVYVDDMLVKSKRSQDHPEHLKQAFSIMRSYEMKLNPDKCTFGVGGGKFLGYMVSERGIEASPEKIQAIMSLRSPTTIQDVQKFISRSADRSLPFFKVLRKSKSFEWIEEYGKALQELKEYLTKPPLLANPKEEETLFLYLAVSENAVSLVLVRDEGWSQNPIYYLSKMLQGAESRYSEMEKLTLTLVVTARMLRPYFQSHKVVVLTNHPLKHVISRLEASGRLIKWTVALGQYDVDYQPRTAQKAQVLADFVTELSSDSELPQAAEGQSCKWMLHIDGSSNADNGGAGILIQGPKKMEIEVAARLSFPVTNNEAEYGTLILGLELA